ncbi:MAG: hypothetical protein EBX40_05195, partial [Gammaproteobacteria bacterium]|nr:hypothetical protein [Gammaproteobacteria bacterium]
MSGSRKAPRAKDVISIPNAEAAARKAKQDLLNQIKEHQSELRAAIEAAFAELFQGIEGTSRRKRTGGTINVYAQSEVDQKLAEIENHFKNQIAQANESKSPNPDDQPSRPRTSSFALNLSRSPSPEATQAEERSPTPQPVATQPNSDALDTAAVLAHYDAMQNALNRFIDEQNGLTEAQKAFFKKAVNDWRIEDAHSRIDQNSNSLSATRSELIGAWGILTTAIATQMQQLQELTDRNQLAAQLKGLKVPTTIPRSAATTETPEQKEESLEEKIQKIAQAHRRLEGQKEQARAEQLKRLAEQQARTAAAKATQTKPTAQKAPPAAPPRAPAKPSQPAAATTKPEAPPKPTNEKASEKKAESKPAPKQPTPAAKTSPQKQHESKPAVPAKPTTPPPAAQTSKSSAAAKP